MDPIYCKVCGKRLLDTYRTDSYDEFTGQPIKTFLGKLCPYNESHLFESSMKAILTGKLNKGK